MSASRKRRHGTDGDGDGDVFTDVANSIVKKNIFGAGATTPRSRGSIVDNKSDADRDEDELQRPAAKRTKFADAGFAADVPGAVRVANDKVRRSNCCLWWCLDLFW